MKLEELEGNVVTALEDDELVAFARLELGVELEPYDSVLRLHIDEAVTFAG